MEREGSRGRSVDVIIPTYKPGDEFRTLLLKLQEQSYPIGHILIINTEESFWREEFTEGISNAEVFHIKKSEFDHGATRDMGAGFSGADLLVYMTQDAIPADAYTIENLVSAFDHPMVKAAYARQLPKPDCHIAEGCVRSFNYPEESHLQSAEDVQEMGVRAFFCSNVCAAYDHRLYTDLGGFTRPCIFNEDMLYAARTLFLGYSVAYVAEARVLHSHNYTCGQQFHRNFDNGVSQAMHPEIFRNIKSTGTGRKMVKMVSRELRQLGRTGLIPGFWVQCGFRLLGFSMGRHYRKLPMWLVSKCTMNQGFWDYQLGEDE
ncbi:MAG: glycosyltransferase [Lachnospiraceae bacterium]|nr:glycosyltransferase [Lachnospiraceae bacterium]